MKFLYASSDAERTWQSRRRATNRDLKRCINHPMTPGAVHAAPIDGGCRCEPCKATHRRSR